MTNAKKWNYAGVAILALMVVGCHPKAQEKKPDDTQPPVTQTPPPATPTEEPSLRGKDYQEVPELSSVFFDLDQSSLRSDARDVLKKNYTALQSHSDWEALVEGHCDERGTTEYNLGLGQKRAAAVRDYYISLGLPGARVATISYGKENPACTEHTDDCWSKNRRGVTKARSSSKPAAASSTNSMTPPAQ